MTTHKCKYVANIWTPEGIIETFHCTTCGKLIPRKTYLQKKETINTETSVVDIHVKNKGRKRFDVYIGRRIQYHNEFTEDSKWANRFYKDLDKYEEHIRQNLWNDLHELRGKKLGCWCINTKKITPIQCHGQILMKLIKKQEEEK